MAIETVAKKCTCTHCHTEAVSIAGKPHRRCIGKGMEAALGPDEKGQPQFKLRDKNKKLPRAARGQWI